MMKCEIGGCYKQPVEKAHIYSKGGGGSKRKHNIINLCVDHHRLDPKSFHRMGVWSFADLHGLRERFEEAFRIEREIEQEKQTKMFMKARAKQQVDRKKFCPTCKRRWTKGVTKEQMYGSR